MGGLVVHLSEVDAAVQAVSGAIDALEAAANEATRYPDKEPARLLCVDALRVAVDERDDKQFDLVEAVRDSLYGPEPEDNE